MVNKDKLIRDYLISSLRRAAVKAAIRKLAVTSSFGQFLVGYIVEEIFDDYGIPLINRSSESIGYHFERFEGKLIARRLDDSHEQSNSSDYDDSIDDIHRL